MSKLNSNKKIYILSGTALIIFIILLVFVIVPLHNQINSYNDEIYDQRVQLTIQKQQRENIEKTQLDYNKIKNEVDKISKVFIQKDNTLDLISDLETIAAQKNIEQKIAITSNSETAPSNTLDLEISLTGPFTAIVQYLVELERFDYYVVIDNLNFISQESGTSLQFSAHTYFQ